MDLLLYGNYDYAGTNKFKHHVIEDGENFTLCGLYVKERRGQWEYEDFSPENVGCLRCKKTLDALANVAIS